MPDQVEDTPAGKETGQSLDTLDAMKDALSNARQESAGRRKRIDELEAQIEELTPIVKAYKEEQTAKQTELERLQARQKELEAEAAKHKAEAEQRAKENRLLGFGVDSTLLPLVNLSALPWDNEDELKAAVGLFVSKVSPQAATPKPVSGKSEDKVWTVERLKAATREEIIANREAINKDLGFKTGRDNRI